MKKSLILAGMLVIGYASAQDGNVGINASKPNATLDIRVASVNASETGSIFSNQGLLIPRISKKRVAQTTTPETSTLVYIDKVEAYTDMGLSTIQKDRVVEVLGEGFYHYNGTRWVRGMGEGKDTSLYTGNGQLVDNRTVDMNGYQLVFNGGNVGFGTDAPSQKLDVAGIVKTNGVLYDSDERLKQQITNIISATTTLSNIRPVTYYWNAEGKKKGGNDMLQYGFIAQEVEKILPNVVSTDTNGYKSVNYNAVVPLLVKALQEKDSDIKSLKTEITELKKIVSELKKQK